jgi:predicted DNA-binding protein YlxM (UPF0122 family)
MKTDNTISEKAYLSIREVAKLRDVTRQRVYQWIKAGMPIKKNKDGRITVKRSVAETYVGENKTGRPKGLCAMTPDEVSKARVMWDNGMILEEIAHRLDHPKSTIWNAINAESTK